MSEAIKLLQAFADDPKGVQGKDRFGGKPFYFKDEDHLIAVLANGYNYIVRMTPKPLRPDLSCLVDSDVICEFWNTSPSGATSTTHMGKLIEIKVDNPDGTRLVYICSSGYAYSDCQPALDLWQVHHGGGCPLPDSAMVEVMFRNGRKEKGKVSNFFDLWKTSRCHRIKDLDIIAYKFTGWEE